MPLRFSWTCSKNSATVPLRRSMQDNNVALWLTNFLFFFKYTKKVKLLFAVMGIKGAELKANECKVCLS